MERLGIERQKKKNERFNKDYWLFPKLKLRAETECIQPTGFPPQFILAKAGTGMTLLKIFGTILRMNKAAVPEQALI